MYCEYTLSIWPLIATNVKTMQQLCPCVAVPTAVRLGERVQSFGENYPSAATTACMYFARLGLYGPYWGRDEVPGGLSFGMIVSAADGCIFKSEVIIHGKY